MDGSNKKPAREENAKGKECRGRTKSTRNRDPKERRDQRPKHSDSSHYSASFLYRYPSLPRVPQPIHSLELAGYGYQHRTVNKNGSAPTNEQRFRTFPKKKESNNKTRIHMNNADEELDTRYILKDSSGEEKIHHLARTPSCSPTRGSPAGSRIPVAATTRSIFGVEMDRTRATNPVPKLSGPSAKSNSPAGTFVVHEN